MTVPATKTQTTITEEYCDTDFNISWGVKLKDSSNTALENKQIKFYVDNTLKDTVTTNSYGADFLCFDYFDGTHTIKAVFEGDNDYEASQLEKTVTIGF